MNLTFGFIAFFVSVIIPGILFRRFFYYGEFSKQFDSKDPVLHSIFYSIVPGVCIQVICFVLGDWLLSFEIDNTQIFNVFKDFVYSGEKDINHDTESFLNDSLDTFIYYSLSIFFVSIVSGHIISRMIRWWGLDKKYKILKFKNQWFYIFSGEILDFEKFELGKTLTTDIQIPHNQKISTTYADVLVDNTDGMRELYTGYVVDYDLCSEDISQLERIYLLDAYRYKKKDKEYAFEKSSPLIKKDSSKLDISLDEVEKQVEYKSRIRKKIPGNVFVVSGKDILNINLTYVPSEKKRKIREQRSQKTLQIISNTYFVISILLILLHFTYKSIGLNATWFGAHIRESNWLAIILVGIACIQILSLFIPSLDQENNKYQYRPKHIFVRLVALIILYIIICLFQYLKLLSPEFPLWNPFI
ncbi:hypothetical protein [Flagellimonas onchidii]|uniref:hypothetical protein n=1 Tax=Flagellimonas onchidii TaxID=2562684 RepID=UPI0010A6A221|nr:hypothetical protein [Allomuricauda onchidii]